MTRSIHARIAISLGSWMVVLGAAMPLWANAGPSSTTVSIVAEPVGIEGVRIARESLTIDLRPLKTAERALVEAVYNLQNDGPERELDLLFAFGSPEHSDCRVTLDDQTIAGIPKETRMPNDWMPPKFTPALNGNGTLLYRNGWSPVPPLSFSTLVPSGSSVLTVRYRATVKYTLARPAMYRQFAYVLAPARSWAGFGGLDLEIHVPEGWSVTSTPALQRRDGTLYESFDDVPADAVGLTLRPPIASGYQTVKSLTRGLWALAAIAGLVLSWRWGCTCGQQRSVIRDLARLIAIGLAYGILMLVAGTIAAWGADRVFPPTASELALVAELRLTDGYANLATMAGIILSSAVAVTVGCVVALTRRARTSGSESTPPPSP